MDLSELIRLPLVLLPLGILLTGISLLKHTTEATATHEPGPDETEPHEAPAAVAVPGVADWLRTFLLVSIPLVGFVLLIVWSFDHKNPVRRNWSVTLYLARILTSILLLYLYVPVLAEEIHYQLPDFYGTFVTTILLLLVLGGIVLLVLHYQFKPYEQNANSHPSVLMWIANFLILAIPLIGIICLIIWATDDRNRVMKKWAAARLVWMAISVVYTLYALYWMQEMARLLQEFVYFRF